jgi:hypothetical protein
VVTDVSAAPDAIRMRGTCDQPVQLRLTGPRASTDWVAVERSEDSWSATISLLADPWALGRVSVPTDRYALTARTSDGDELDVVVDTALENGALGARMTGGGFGGSAIALLPTDSVDPVAAAVAAAFEDRGWQPPGLLTATPSPGARRTR